MKIMFSAGEVSGDVHGQSLAESILRMDSSVELIGFGGSRMGQAGVRLCQNFADYNVMGVWEVLINLRRIMRLLDELTEFMKQHEAKIIVRGVRSVKDLEYEENAAYMNRHLAPEIDTVFLLTRPDYSFVSSSGIRELCHFHGSVHGLVPICVEQAIESAAIERK